jgi:hypothetical protein
VNRGSTLFLKAVISLAAIAALAVCIFGLPGLIAREAAKTPKTAYLVYLALVYAYILSIPFFVGLYQAFKLLTSIDGNKAFSESSAGPLKRLKYCAIAGGVLMGGGIAALMVLSRGKGEDITGIVAPGLLVILASGAVAAVAAAFQKRMQNAAHKSEIDRTVFGL